jgi:hypothetical protein
MSLKFSALLYKGVQNESYGSPKIWPPVLPLSVQYGYPNCKCQSSGLQCDDAETELKRNLLWKVLRFFAFKRMFFFCGFKNHTKYVRDVL